MVEQRRRRLPISSAQLIMLAAVLVAAVVGGAIGFASGVNDARGGPPIAVRPWVGWGLLATLAFAVAVTLPYWRRLDEAAREAHKSAWLWGGGGGFTIAAAVAGLLLLLPTGIALPSLSHRVDDAGRIVDGVFLTILLESIGYGLLWLLWWSRRR